MEKQEHSYILKPDTKVANLSDLSNEDIGKGLVDAGMSFLDKITGKTGAELEKQRLANQQKALEAMVLQQNQQGTIEQTKLALEAQKLESKKITYWILGGFAFIFLVLGFVAVLKFSK